MIIMDDKKEVEIAGDNLYECIEIPSRNLSLWCIMFMHINWRIYKKDMCF